MKRVLNKFYVFGIALFLIVLALFIFTDNHSNADSLEVYLKTSEESVETYQELQNWLKDNPDFPYAGALIDDEGNLNVLVKETNSIQKSSITNLFGNDVIVSGADVTLKEIKDVYNTLKEKNELLKEKGVPIEGFYIRETDNKLYLELKGIDNDSINIINELIGEHSFIEYSEVTGPVEEQSRNSRIRPLVGGIRISYPKSGQNYYSTLSFTAYDRVGGSAGDLGFVMSGHAASGASASINTVQPQTT